MSFLSPAVLPSLGPGNTQGHGYCQGYTPDFLPSILSCQSFPSIIYLSPQLDAEIRGTLVLLFGSF